MIYIHCTAPSEGAVLLAETLRERGLRAVRSRDIEWLQRRLKGNDLIIGWGDRVPFEGLSVLNGSPLRSKFEEISLLSDGDIPVPPFDTKNWGEGWIGRSLHHQEGSDFLPRGERPPVAFYTRKLDIIEEFRFHIFTLPEGVKSIRAGKKLPRSSDHHKWVRSWDMGWKIAYGLPNETFPKKGREVAKKAIKAVGYDFGAVDVGLLKGGKEVVVLEVNSRPGFEVGGQTVQKYAEAVGKVVGGV
jgi:hypothetical protein